MIHLNTCPLCTKPLRLKKASGVSVYFCPAEEKTHYEVEKDEKNTIQHLYAFPYALDNYEKSKYSRVYRWKNERWHFVKEVPQIAPQPKDELFNTLRNIVIPGAPPFPIK